MLRYNYIFYLSLLGILMLLQSCISVQPMRYRTGLNIQFQRKERGNENVKTHYKKPKVSLKKTTEFVFIDSTFTKNETDKSGQYEFATTTNHFQENLKKSDSIFTVIKLKKVEIQNTKTIVARKHETNNKVGKFTSIKNGIEKPNEEAPITDNYSIGNLALHVLFGIILAAVTIALILLPFFLLLTVGIVGIVGIIGFIIAYLVSIEGLKTMRIGWKKAYPKQWYIKFFYILLCIPAFLVCSTVLIISKAFLETSNFDTIDFDDLGD